jgi:hypothetical protein
MTDDREGAVVAQGTTALGPRSRLAERTLADRSKRDGKRMEGRQAADADDLVADASRAYVAMTMDQLWGSYLSGGYTYEFSLAFGGTRGRVAIAGDVAGPVTATFQSVRDGVVTSTAPHERPRLQAIGWAVDTSGKDVTRHWPRSVSSQDVADVVVQSVRSVGDDPEGVFVVPDEVDRVHPTVWDLEAGIAVLLMPTADSWMFATSSGTEFVGDLKEDTFVPDRIVRQLAARDGFWIGGTVCLDSHRLRQALAKPFEGLPVTGSATGTTLSLTEFLRHPVYAQGGATPEVITYSAMLIAGEGEDA